MSQWESVRHESQGALVSLVGDGWQPGLGCGRCPSGCPGRTGRATESRDSDKEEIALAAQRVRTHLWTHCRVQGS